MPEAVIVSTARSPIGRAHKGSLKDVRPDDLTVQMVQAALEKVPELTTTDIEDLMLGVGQPSGEAGFNIGRVVGVLAGLDHLAGVTVNRYCAASVQTMRMALHAIKAGEGEVYIAGGVETISRYQPGWADGPSGSENPVMATAQARTAGAAAGGPTWSEPREQGLLPDVYMSMGLTAENVAQLKNVSRADQDAFAARSQNRAVEAIESGFWAREITPVTLADGSVVASDDGPRRGVTTETLEGLRPVFRPDGTVTAGNCCALNDGAAVTIIMSDTKAKALGLTPIARIVSTGVSGLSPEIMGLGPVDASRLALKRAGMTMNDIDLVEINEAFAAQVIASARELDIEEDKLNVNGGAIAVGHPFGATGARIATTLINSMQWHDKQYGLETMCVGGGQGMAMVLERLS
ncbi:MULTISPECIES: acetyl-CoA C-acetyltransferase [unclassified Aeromicrobium]|uniref:acetyl-CoA C-acetyltransferase n=1 Tax=unclassified Aeromicrobium TaxID=2633570 RepID=UPI0028896EEB|nr:MULTISPECIES: acetyl-CoA C-acetyltransferase [unclassified Aeromicrobium]